ncbi:efflux transporter outer membrane subunit [Stenotrophomonas acidaminiphila]|uniref:efflux transporter outer membrane subunit n=1 Tax=Stenotrophomonas acidaminiphila TaxID=128780 RepID=UPI0039BC596D
MRNPKLTLCALASVLALSACSFAPTYETPAAPLPAAYPQASAAAPVALAVPQWESFVQSPALRDLVQQALTHNRDLRQTLIDVEAVRAQYRIQRADRLPNLNLQGSGSRQRIPADVSQTQAATVQSSYEVGVGLVAFELDLFGRVRNLSQAALQQYLATESAAQATRITLVGEVMRTWLLRNSAHQRYQLAQQTLQSREAGFQLIGERHRNGVASALDLQDARGLAAQARAEQEATDREFRQASNALALLVGANDASSLPAPEPYGTQVLAGTVTPGLPAELLTRRPDIRAAEHRLQARNADIGAARAAFFPRISLTGALGTSSAELSGLFGSGSHAWSFMPQISLPIFDGGRNTANLDLATLRRDGAVVAYEQAVQSAFRETADALAATETLDREQAARLELAQSSTEGLRLSELRYRQGVDSHLRYLDAQRRNFADRTSLIEVTTERQLAASTLFKALGGGWQAAANTDAALAPR